MCLCLVQRVSHPWESVLGCYSKACFPQSFFFFSPALCVSGEGGGGKKEVFLSRTHNVPVHAVLSCLAQAGRVFALDLALT